MTARGWAAILWAAALGCAPRDPGLLCDRYAPGSDERRWCESHRDAVLRFVRSTTDPEGRRARLEWFRKVYAATAGTANEDVLVQTFLSFGKEMPTFVRIFDQEHFWAVRDTNFNPDLRLPLMREGFRHAMRELELELELGPSPAAWIDLLPDATLKGWRRVPIKPLAAKAVWSVSPEGHLVVDGVGATEMLLCERDFGDGTLRVEWRYRPNDDPAYVYNGGVYVRTALDGKTWVQAQVAHGAKPPVCGDLIAMLPGATERTDVLQKGPSPAHPPGEWNTYEITCRGRSVSITVNGKTTLRWDDCPSPRGAVGLQAEFAVYEVRAFRFLPR